MSDRGARSVKIEAELCEPQYGLRDYQRQVVQDTLAILNRKRARVVIHLPTGAGKTRIATSLVARLMVVNPKPDGVLVWLAYSEELCDQAARALQDAWIAIGDRPLAVSWFTGNKYGNLLDTPSGFLVCSLSKLWEILKKGQGTLAEFAPRVSGIVFDEAHQAIAATFAQVTDQLSAWPVPIIGLTATPGRHSLEKGGSERLAEFFNHVKVTIDPRNAPNPIEYLIQKRYLARPITKQISLDGIVPQPSSGSNDYTPDYRDLLGQIPEWLDAVRQAIDDACRRCLRIIVFAPSVATALSLSKEYEMKVVSSEAVVGNMPSHKRANAIQRFCEEPTGRNDRRLLFNHAILTTGFDVPKIDAVVVARPTKSAVLYSQMVGRGLRGKNSRGTSECYIYTVTDSKLRGFESAISAFTNWEDLWQ